MAAFEKLVDLARLARFKTKLRTETDGTYAKKTDTVLDTTLSMGRKSGTTAGDGSTAAGYEATASGNYSHAEGYNNTASAVAAHAEGGTTQATMNYAHAEGSLTAASGNSSHAEGLRTAANGAAAHAEGAQTTAGGVGAHAEGNGTTASGNYSHAEGEGTIAASANQHVEGKYNVADSAGRYAHIVGWGSSSTRRNIHTLKGDGSAEYLGDVRALGCGFLDEPYSLVNLHVPLIIFPKVIYSSALTTNESFIMILGNVAHFFLKFRYSSGFTANKLSEVYQTPIIPLWAADKDGATSTAESLGYGVYANQRSTTGVSTRVFITPSGKIVLRNYHSSTKAAQTVDAYFCMPFKEIDKSKVVEATAEHTLDEAYYNWLVQGCAELCVPSMGAANGGVVIDGTVPETGPFDINDLINMCYSTERVSFYQDVDAYLTNGTLPY